MTLEYCRRKMPHRHPSEVTERWPDPTDPRSTIDVAVARVPLPGGSFAYLRASAFNDLMRRGFSDQLYVRHNGKGNSYLTTTHPAFPGRVYNVSRLVAGAVTGQRLRLRDQDPGNLRDGNVTILDAA